LVSSNPRPIVALWRGFGIPQLPYGSHHHHRVFANDKGLAGQANIESIFFLFDWLSE